MPKSKHSYSMTEKNISEILAILLRLYKTEEIEIKLKIIGVRRKMDFDENQGIFYPTLYEVEAVGNRKQQEWFFDLWNLYTQGGI